MSKKLSPEAQEAYKAIQRCVAAVPLKPLSSSLEDFPGSVMMPVRPKKPSPPRKNKKNQ